MKLTIRERLVISQLYPQKGNMIEQTLVEDIVKKVRISQEEIKEIGLKVQATGTGGVSYIWDEAKAKDLDVDLTKAELGLLKERDNSRVIAYL